MKTSNKCSGRMWNGYTFHVCGVNAAYEHEGKHFCKTHHTPTMQAKANARQAAWQAEFQRKDEARKAATAAQNEQKRRAELFPEMLSALQMAKHIVANEGTDEQMQQIFAAIEKATGEKA